MEQSYTPSISGSGFESIEAGAELFGILRVGQEELVVPQNRDLLASIAGFVNKYEDAIPRIRQAMRRIPRGETPLVHISRFVNLQSKRMDMRAALSELEREISLYE